MFKIKLTSANSWEYLLKSCIVFLILLLLLVEEVMEEEGEQGAAVEVRGQPVGV